MSLYRLDSEHKRTQVGVGWSPNFDSFFCWVVIEDTGDRNNPAISMPFSELVMNDPDVLIKVIEPYSKEFDHSWLLHQLQQDRIHRSETELDVPSAKFFIKVMNKAKRFMLGIHDWE
jgi:hypothetical protein